MPALIHSTRRRPDTRINLSSNELINLRLSAIHGSAPEYLTPALLSCYPVASQIGARLARYFGAEPDEVVMTPGSDSALRHICGYYARKGGTAILTQYPNYAAWEQAARSLGLDLRRAEAPLADPAAQGQELLRLAQATGGALIAVSIPNGFSGGCVLDADLDALISIARHRGHTIVIDACYQAFNGPLRAQFARRGGPVLVVQSLSKSHGLAGARIALVGGDAEFIADLDAGPLEHAVSGPAFLAADIALDHHSEFEAIWAQVRATRQRCAAELRELGLTPLASGANFLTVRVGTDRDAAAVTELLSESGYRIRNLSQLPGMSGCLRFAIGDAPTAGRFIDAFARALTAATAPARPASTPPSPPTCAHEVPACR